MENINMANAIETIERLVRENDRLIYEAKEKELRWQLEQEKREIIAKCEKHIAEITAKYEARIKEYDDNVLELEDETDNLREINAQLQIKILEMQRHK